MDRVQIDDVSVGAPRDVPAPVPGGPDRRPVPRVLVGALSLSLLTGVAGAAFVQAAERRRARADADLTVTVVVARSDSGTTAGAPVSADAAVALELRVSVPVRVLDAELDGAPPVSRFSAHRAVSRSPSVLVRWRVLCAEVGTIPGPRLLDVDVSTGSGDQHRRITLATSDDDPVARVFRLSAAQECGAGRS